MIPPTINPPTRSVTLPGSQLHRPASISRKRGVSCATASTAILRVLQGGRAPALAECDPRIEQRIAQIGEQIDGNDEKGEHEGDHLHQWVVASENRADHQGPETWHGKDGLDNDRTSDE